MHHKDPASVEDFVPPTVKHPRLYRAFVKPTLGGMILAGLLSLLGTAIDYGIETLEDIQQEQKELRRAIIDSRILTIDTLDHIKSLVLASGNMPMFGNTLEPDSVLKARKQAKRIQQTREVFPEEDLELE
jgi:hypothetical protein